MQIVFHVLEEANLQQSLLYACKLIEQAHGEQKRVYIHTSSQAEAERIDNLLWTYNEESFLPHAIYHPSLNSSAPIQIGYGNEVPAGFDILINLHRDVPAFYQQFNQLIEIVFPDQLVQQLARERFKHYRDQGHDLTTHKIKKPIL